MVGLGSRWDSEPLARLVLPIALALAALLLALARLRFAVTEPLWFDETFTLAIVSRPDWASFWREVYLDSNGPAYYLLMRVWTGLFGHSDLALRAPSLLAILAAGLLPLVICPPEMTRRSRLAWAALIYSWWGVGYFLDARCYGLLLAVSTWQCLVFAKLMARPGLRTALIWAATAALAILLHYYAVFLGMAQGLIYLARHRHVALRTWPAGLAFLPSFGWIAYHAPRLKQYSGLARIWHPPLEAGRIFEMAGFVLGPTSPLIFAGVATILAVGLSLGRVGSATPADVEPKPSGALVMTVVSGGLALALVVGFGLLGSGLSPRYLIPLGPPLVLGVVLVAGRSVRAPLIYLALITLYFGAQVQPVWQALGPKRAFPRYEFETAAGDMMAHRVTDLVFVWDHELTSIMAPTTLERVGGVFFARAGYPIRVRPLAVDAKHDPNLAILAAAQGPRPGLIWMFNRAGHTAAHRFPPTIARLDPRWSCAESGDGVAGSLRCYRAATQPGIGAVGGRPAP